MSSKRLVRRKGVLSTTIYSRTNSLDWDSPSTKTGTVKRRPSSIEYSCNEQLNLADKNELVSLEMKEQVRIHKATIKSNTDKNKHPSMHKIQTKYDGMLDLQNLIKFDTEVQGEVIQQNGRVLARDVRNRNKMKEGNSIRDAFESKDDFKVDRFSFDNSKCLSLTEVNAYLIERKASGFNVGKAGIVSDSDSGIASPLSPSSLYGFLVCGDKNETCKLDVQIGMELERLRKCTCIQQQIEEDEARSHAIYIVLDMLHDVIPNVNCYPNRSSVSVVV
ncbi:hypothetical protein FQA39_LY06432 [Lamprigera yunnana]|nr:hypothetical protein FQA39_LY06432 [Lamprigera yunnana]